MTFESLSLVIKTGFIQRLIAAGLLSTVLFTGVSHSTVAESDGEKSASALLESAGAQKLERDGVAIEFEVMPDSSESSVVEGQYADVEFRITDSLTGEPIQGIYPAVWLDIAKAWDQQDKESSVECRDRVQFYLQGIVGMRPLVDLNSYFVLVMNQDHTITVIDPIIGITGITKLYANINLAAPGADWTKTSDEKRLFVTMPTRDQIALVDLLTFKVITNIDAGINPIRVDLQPDEKYIWVANNHRETGKSGVTIIDVATYEKAGFIATGPGHHEIAFSQDSRFAYITNRNEGTVSVIDTASLSKVKDIEIGPQVIDIAWSELSESLYVTDGESGQISIIDGASHEIVKRVKVQQGVGPIGVSQDGRWMIALNSFQDVVYALDVSDNELKHTIVVGRKPYQVEFTRAFAFVRTMGSERVNMIDINHLSTMEDVPVASFAAGSNAPGKTRDLGLASSMKQAPGEAAILVVSPSDNTVYYYMEGMNAPMGNFRNYGRRPRAVEVADRTLREEKPGVYRAKVRIPAAGVYDVAFLMESPSIIHCFSMAADRDPSLHIDAAAGLEFIDLPKTVGVDEKVKLRFRLTDPESGDSKTDLKDVRVRYYRAPAFDRREDFATEIGDGVYELETSLPNAGLYYFFVGTNTGKLNFGDKKYISIRATEAETSSN